MSIQENDIKEIVQLIEKMIDKRYHYLHEREYENYNTCRAINAEYQVVVEELIKKIKEF
jgi:hypothetical protein